jgi:hypothetical protein
MIHVCTIAPVLGLLVAIVAITTIGAPSNTLAPSYKMNPFGFAIVISPW